MFKKSSASTFLITCVLCLFLNACDSDPVETFDLEVSWAIAGQRLCSALLPEEEFSVDRIEFIHMTINLYKDEDLKNPLQNATKVPCTDFSHTITRLERGKYFVKVEAYAEYEEQVFPFFSGVEEIRITSDGDTIQVPLSLGGGEIQVVWKFEGGMICGLDMAGEVKEVSFELNGQEYSSPCGEGQVIIEDIYTGDSFTAEGKAFDQNGDTLYTTIYENNPFKVLPGQRYKVELVFE
jgi:hypothetical protein